MDFKFLEKISKDLKEELIKVTKAKKNNLLTRNRDKNRLVKFYCALHDYGKEILDWELETFEIVLGRSGMSHKEIMDIAYVAYILKNENYVLSDNEHFENAVCVVNDIEVDVESTPFHPPHFILWGIVAIKALLNAEGFPFIGRALEYIILDFLDYGWTTAPLFLADIEYVRNNFPFNNDEYIKSGKRMTAIQIVTLSQTLKEPQNGFENYIKMHAPLISYLEDKFTETARQIKEVINWR